MKPEGWIMILTPIVCIVTGFIVLVYSRIGKKNDGLTAFITLLLAVAIGAFTFIVSFIPFYLLACLFWNPSARPHPVMPMGQAFFGGFFAIVSGIVLCIISYTRIMRWIINKLSSRAPQQISMLNLTISLILVAFSAISLYEVL